MKYPFQRGAAILALFFLLSPGCATTDEIRYDSASMAYAHKDGTADARVAFDNKDYEVYSAMGFGEYFPGLDFALGRSLENRFGSRCLPSTSDMIKSAAHKRYIDAATSYASAYNRELVRLLKAEPRILQISRIENSPSAPPSEDK